MLGHPLVVIPSKRFHGQRASDLVQHAPGRSKRRRSLKRSTIISAGQYQCARVQNDREGRQP